MAKCIGRRRGAGAEAGGTGQVCVVCGVCSVCVRVCCVLCVVCCVRTCTDFGVRPSGPTVPTEHARLSPAAAGECCGEVGEPGEFGPCPQCSARASIDMAATCRCRDATPHAVSPLVVRAVRSAPARISNASTSQCPPSAATYRTKEMACEVDSEWAGLIISLVAVPALGRHLQHRVA